MLGAGAFAISVISGAGEFLGYNIRMFSGRGADRAGRYWPITTGGYILQMSVVPLLALAGNWQVAALLPLFRAAEVGIGAEAAHPVHDPGQRVPRPPGAGVHPAGRFRAAGHRALLAKATAIGAVVAVIGNSFAKLRLFKITEFVAGASLLAVLGVFTLYLGVGDGSRPGSGCLPGRRQRDRGAHAAAGVRHAAAGAPIAMRWSSRRSWGQVAWQVVSAMRARSRASQHKIQHKMMWARIRSSLRW